MELHDKVGANASKYITQAFLLQAAEALTELTNDTSRDTFEVPLHFVSGCTFNLGIKAFSTLYHQPETQAAKGQVKTINFAYLVNAYDGS